MMSMPVKTEFDVQYSFLVRRLLSKSMHLNARTQKMVRATDGVFFRVGEVPLLNLRDINPLWTCVESVWFMSGSRDVDFMRQHGFKNWDPFTEKDGYTVDSATGWRWRHAHKVDQLQEVIDKLARDSTNRQAVMTSWMPDKDLVNPGPNAPCLLTWHVHILDGAVHMTVMQRSCDLYFGLPHDIFGARIVQEMIAAILGIPPGNLSYAVSNVHLYEDQWPPAKEMASREENLAEVSHYPKSLGITRDLAVAATAGADKAVDGLMDLVKAFYSPFPRLAGPKIVK